jgi:hypothetical protein
MNRNVIDSAIDRHYKDSKLSFQQLVEMVEEQYDLLLKLRLVEKNLPTKPPTDVKNKKDILLRLPIIRLSEKEWGKEGTRDRETVQNLLQKIVGQGQDLKEKVRLVSNFVQSPPETEDISEVLSHIVLLDTLTNIMVHFNASAAGFTFEGFLAALLEGQQVPAGTAGIQDILDNDKSPVSLKLLTEAGPAAVEGSFKDLCDHFIDPGGLKQDPDSDQYLGRSGAEGGMTYVVALKSFREKTAQAALTGDEAQTIRFYQFEFDAENFLDAMRSNSHNARLLLLPADLPDDPSDDPASTSIGVGPGEFNVEEFILTNFTQEDYQALKSEYKNKLKILAMKYDTDYARNLFSKMEIIPIEGSKKLKLVWRETGKEFSKPRTDTKKQLPWEPPHGSEHLRNIGATSHESYLDYKSSIRKLESALSGPNGAAAFWKLISLSLGYTGGVKGVTQFEIKREYYERKSFDQHGMGFIGQIPVGRAAVTELAQKYVDVLNQQIFELFARVEKLTNEINAYFVGGDKDMGIEAARTAGQIEKRTRKYVKGTEET